jgi:hypothetical protein
VLVSGKGKPMRVRMGGHRSSSSSRRGTMDVGEPHGMVSRAGGGWIVAGIEGAHERRRRHGELGCPALFADDST